MEYDKEWETEWDAPRPRYEGLPFSIPPILAGALSVLAPKSSLHSHPPASSLPLSFSTVPSSFPVCSHPSVNPQATGQRTVPEEEEEECGCCGRWGHIFMKMAEGSAEMRRRDRKESKGLTSSLKTTSETTTIINFFTFRCDTQMQRHFWLVCQSFISKEDVNCVVNRLLSAQFSLSPTSLVKASLNLSD